MLKWPSTPMVSMGPCEMQPERGQTPGGHSQMRTIAHSKIVTGHVANIGQGGLFHIHKVAVFQACRGRRGA